MASLIFLIIGILIIIISIIFITSQSNQNNISEEFLQKDDELVITIESLENIIGDINDTFNDTIKEMEEKYERLDSKIQHVDNKVIEKETNYENKLNHDIDNKITREKNNINEQNDEINNNIDQQEPQEKQSSLVDTKACQIIKLRNRGLSAQQIAKELNIGTGEVMLILNLKRFE